MSYTGGVRALQSCTCEGNVVPARSQDEAAKEADEAGEEYVEGDEESESEEEEEDEEQIEYVDEEDIDFDEVGTRPHCCFLGP